MPKGFSDKEKELIRQKLIEAGKEIFGRYGFKKASIDEAVSKAGISKGAFYLFFTSKELYFMEVLESIEQKFRTGLEPIISDKTLAPQKRFKLYLQKSMEFVELNPLLAKIKRQELEVIMLNLPPEKLNKHLEADTDFLLRFLTDLRAEAGYTTPIPEKAVSGFFHSLFFIFLHKDELGAGEYQPGMELLLDMASRYFFEC